MARFDGTILDEAGDKSKSAITALKDTDYRDKAAYFKMAQLLIGLAGAAEDSKIAKKFLDGVSDAMTTVAKSVLGSEEKKEGSDEEAI